jgi:hypothetical protein
MGTQSVAAQGKRDASRSRTAQHGGFRAHCEPERGGGRVRWIDSKSADVVRRDAQIAQRCSD